MGRPYLENTRPLTQAVLTRSLNCLTPTLLAPPAATYRAIEITDKRQMSLLTELSFGEFAGCYKLLAPTALRSYGATELRRNFS